MLNGSNSCSYLLSNCTINDRVKKSFVNNDNLCEIRVSILDESRTTLVKESVETSSLLESGNDFVLDSSFLDNVINILNSNTDLFDKLLLHIELYDKESGLFLVSKDINPIDFIKLFESSSNNFCINDFKEFVMNSASDLGSCFTLRSNLVVDSFKQDFDVLWESLIKEDDLINLEVGIKENVAFNASFDSVSIFTDLADKNSIELLGIVGNNNTDNVVRDFTAKKQSFF